MTFVIQPIAFLRGSVNLPSSKSYSIRSIFIAACGGKSCIHDISFCDDAQAALRAAKYLGAKVQSVGKNSFLFSSQKKTILKSYRLNIGESGTVLRFILPLAALKKKTTMIQGQGTLRNRPNRHLVEALQSMGGHVQGRGSLHAIPITVKGGFLRSGHSCIDGTASSQFVSALLIACPLLSGDTHLFVKGRKIVSRDYIQMTLSILKKAGIRIRKISDRVFFIKGGQRYQGLRNFRVPSDYGLAAFWLAAASLTKSDLVLKGYFDSTLLQADGAIIPFLKKMGVRFQKRKEQIRIKGPFELKGGSFSLRDAPDLLPIMSILALFANSKTRLYGIAHARIKESDRISDLRNELLKIGAKVIEKKEELIIHPQKKYHQNVVLDSRGDHRLAMAFAMLGLKIGTRVKHMECSSKSYPAFVHDLKKMIKKPRTTKSFEC